MSKEITLIRGKYALVDDSDFEWLNQWKWHCTYFGYAARRQGKQIIPMHREIMRTPDGNDTDHINRNRLDNRRCNLRVASRSQNMFNTSLRKDNTSGKKGVSWSKRAHKWQVGIVINGKRIHLGFFGDLNLAAKVYEDRAKQFHGEFARIT